MSVRRIEAQVLFDGQSDSTLALVEFEVDASRYESCDVASLRFALSSVMGGSSWFEAAQPDRKWVTLQMRDVAQTFGDWVTVFEGRIDHIGFSAELGLVDIECRDALAALVDLRVQDAWLNHTQQELLQIMAQAAGLDAHISLPDEQASLMAGQFWQVEHKRGALMGQNRFQTAGDLAFTVARDSFCDLYADGTSLVCQPIGSATDYGAVVTDVRNLVLRTSVSRDLQLLSGFAVHMASWDSRQRSASNIYYDGASFSDRAPTNGIGIHSFRIPGRRMEELKRLAKGKYARIAAHALSIDVRMPGIIALKPREFMMVGTSGWSETLGIDQVVSRFSLETGFVQNVALRNRGGLSG